MKKMYSVLLALVVLVGFAGFVPAGAAFSADDLAYLATITAMLNTYNITHGGAGALSAELGCDEFDNVVVIVTGNVTGATKGLSLQGAYVDLIWRAKLTGNTTGEALIYNACGRFETGTEILTNGRAIEGAHISVYGGTITGAIHVTEGWLFIGGGVIASDLIYASNEDVLFIEGNAKVEGSIVSSRPISINGDAVVNSSSISAPSVSIENSAKVNADDISGIMNGWITIAPTATTNFADKLTNCVYNSTVLGTVTISLGREVWETLYIPAGAKLTIGDGVAFVLKNGAKLVIDGELVLPKNFDFSEWDGRVTGKNAGDLKGKYTTWWRRAPNWAQWFLRYICFGWIWMKP